MVDFVAIPSATPAPGLVLRLSGREPTYLRITHRFNTCVYAMWVSDAKLAHDARRPQRLLLHELAELANATGSEWGRIVLPDAFKNIPDPKSDPDIRLQAIWKLVEPLLSRFERDRLRASAPRQGATAMRTCNHPMRLDKDALEPVCSPRRRRRCPTLGKPQCNVRGPELAHPRRSHRHESRRAQRRRRNGQADRPANSSCLRG